MMDMLAHYGIAYCRWQEKLSKIEEMNCCYCQSKSVVRAGRNASGSQRYWCKECGKHFTPHPNPIGYSAEVRTQAVRMVADSLHYRQTARYLKVNHQSVINWFRAEARARAGLAQRPRGEQGEPDEMDEFFTSVGGKQRNLRRGRPPR